MPDHPMTVVVTAGQSNYDRTLIAVRVIRRSWVVLSSLVTVIVGVLTICNSLHVWPYKADKPTVLYGFSAPPTSTPKDASCPQVDKTRVTTFVRIDQKTPDTPCWMQVVNGVLPRTVVQYMITYRNNTQQTQKHVVVRADLAPKLLLTPNSTYLKNDTVPGLPQTNNDIIVSGIDIGTYAPGAGAYVLFSVSSAAESDILCGTTQFRTVGAVRYDGGDEYYNTVDTNVEKSC